MPPEETLQRLTPLLSIFGITRIANVTGLDNVGIAVVIVCRPNSRSLSVSQGKGTSLAAAKVSAIMESVEAWHAERIVAPLRLAPRSQLVNEVDADVVDGERLARVSVSRWDEHLRIPWIEGVDARTQGACWVPYEMVHLDLTLPLPEGSGCFVLGSNGLASGNTHLEATVHAVCELIERDAYAVWHHASLEERAVRRLDLDSVTDPVCASLIGRLADAGLIVAVWDITTDVGVAAFHCTVLPRRTDMFRPLYPSSGLGCHPDRHVALARALSEAAQSRLTRISSSRDDVPRSDYELTRNPDLIDEIRARLLLEQSARRLDDVPTFGAPTFAEDLGWILAQLESAGFDRTVIVDLTHRSIGIPVVRAVVPGLEGKPTGPGYRPGARARAASALWR